MNLTCMHAKVWFKSCMSDRFFFSVTLDLAKAITAFHCGIIFAFLPYTHADSHSLKDSANGGLPSTLPAFNFTFPKAFLRTAVFVEVPLKGKQYFEAHMTHS